MSVAHSAGLHHTCFLVKDLEKAAGELARSLSVTWNLWTIEPEQCSFNGKSAPFSFRVAIAEVGNASLELITPKTGETIYDEHLKTKGEGFHHTCFAYADLESMQSAKDELLHQGHTMIQHGSSEGVFEFCYFELPAGIILELLYLKELPPPEKTIG